MQIELSDLITLYNRIEMIERKNEELEMKIVELQTRILELEGRGNIPANRPSFPVQKVGEKYKKLAEYLYEKWERSIELTYTQIEEILGFSLPPTAYNLPQSYWANTETHSYAKGSWLAVGYKAKVMGSQKVKFERNIY